jgi:23S rRNA pseudouridine1911/1915/1917 synthase
MIFYLKLNFEKKSFEKRLDIYLANFFYKDYCLSFQRLLLYYPSRNLIKNLIENKRVYVDHILIIKPSFLLKFNNLITIILPNEINTLLPEPLYQGKKKVYILYEDKEIAVIYKPNNIVMYDNSNRIHHETLVKTLQNLIFPLVVTNEKFRFGLIHRLDKQTTGLLIVAKTITSYKILKEDMRRRRIKRAYYALVNGLLQKNQGEINFKISRNLKKRHQMIIDQKSDQGKEAKTYFHILERYKNYTLVKCFLETGRTHQIRVHFKFIGHSVFNDPIYSSQRLLSKNNFDKSFGQYLHAKEIEFQHPITRDLLFFSTKLPDIFLKKLFYLEKTKMKN